MDHDKHDVGQLEARMKKYQEVAVRLSNAKDTQEWFRTIRLPGWTTPAEFAFALGILESMVAQASALESLQGSLFEASRRVNAQPVR